MKQLQDFLYNRATAYSHSRTIVLCHHALIITFGSYP